MKKLLLGLVALLALYASPALAQSGCSYIITNAVLTAAQWNSCFQAKTNNLGYTPVNKAGDSMAGGLVLATPGTRAGLTFQLGVPAAAANGDTWMTSQGLFFQPNGISLGPFNTPFYTGTAAPTVPIPYSFWNNTSGATIPLSIYDGAQWVALGILNPSTHQWDINPNSVGTTTPGTGKFTTLQATGNITANITGSTQCVQANTSGVRSGTAAGCASAAIATRFVFTTTGAGTYTRTNANVRQLLVRMCGGGAGGGGWNGSTAGGTGGTTSFGSTTAIGGTGGTTGSNTGVGTGGAGGTGGVNTGATNPLRTNGGNGASGSQSAAAFAALGGLGGASIMGGSGAYCSGGNGGQTSAASGNGSGGAGGAGEGVEFLVNAPGSTIAFSVGVGGTSSTGGSTNGAVGQQGVIMVEERY